MSIKSLNPYLHFDGTAEKAIKLYESVLGARTEGLMRFGEMPGNHPAPENKDRIMHSTLHIGPAVLMVSDTMSGAPAAKDGNVHVVLHYDDVAEMTRAFDALAAGGKVDMPLADTFWGARFGMLTDAFGIEWMFNCEVKKAG